MCDQSSDPTQHDRSSTSIASDIARARALGLSLKIGADDRVPADRRNPATACPTCDDGVLTITHPRRCRECVAVMS